MLQARSYIESRHRCAVKMFDTWARCHLRSRHVQGPAAAQEHSREVPPDNGVALGHLARAERQAGGDDGWQALGDGRHGQGDRDLEVVDAAAQGEADCAPVGDPGGALDRLPGQEVVVVDHPHQHAHCKDDLRSAGQSRMAPRAVSARALAVSEGRSMTAQAPYERRYPLQAIAKPQAMGSGKAHWPCVWRLGKQSLTACLLQIGFAGRRIPAQGARQRRPASSSEACPPPRLQPL